MSEYDFLRSSEVLLLADEGVFLTNERIIWFERVKTSGFFSKSVEELHDIPLSSIVMHNGEPQVKIVGDFFDPELQVQHMDGIQTFDFSTRKTEKRWLDALFKELTGHAATRSATQTASAIPGLDAVRDSIGSVAADLGLKDIIQKEVPVVTNCESCGAPLSGVKGDRKTCEYCGNTQVL